MGSESKTYYTSDGDEIKIWFTWDRSCNRYYSKVEIQINDRFYIFDDDSSNEFWLDMKDAIVNQFKMREPNKGGMA